MQHLNSALKKCRELEAELDRESLVEMVCKEGVARIRQDLEACINELTDDDEWEEELEEVMVDIGGGELVGLDALVDVGGSAAEEDDEEVVVEEEGEEEGEDMESEHEPLDGREAGRRWTVRTLAPIAKASARRFLKAAAVGEPEETSARPRRVGLQPIAKASAAARAEPSRPPAVAAARAREPASSSRPLAIGQARPVGARRPGIVIAMKQRRHRGGKHKGRGSK